MKLVVTIPAQNEEKTIAQVIAGIPRKIPGIEEIEVVVVNDGSTDRTAEVAERSGAIVINVTGRPGLGYIFRTGLERAMRRGADIIVNIDGDGQFNSGDISKLIEPLLMDEADFVTCSRFANPEFRPVMPSVKYWGNKGVTRIINWVCGGTSFTDVSCGFRAFNREAAYRLTLFGRYTYTQETFIDLFSKGLRIAEVPLRVRGVREHGKSRVASNLWKYASNSLPIILRAMRDIQPLKFFGGIGVMVATPGILMAGFVTVHYLLNQKTTPYTSLIPMSGALVMVGFLMVALALLADMLGRHRRISEELLYLARRKIYSSRRTLRTALPPTPEEPHPAGTPTLHDTWSLPVMKVLPQADGKDDSGAPVGSSMQDHPETL